MILMTLFPSNCHVYRTREGSRYVVNVFGYASGCSATGSTWDEAETKALQWVYDNLKRRGLIGKIALLDVELTKLTNALAQLQEV